MGLHRTEDGVLLIEFVTDKPERSYRLESTITLASRNTLLFLMPLAADSCVGAAKGVRREAGPMVFRAPIKTGRAFQRSVRGPWVPSLGLMGRDHLGARYCSGRYRGQAGCLGPCIRGLQEPPSRSGGLRRGVTPNPGFHGFPIGWAWDQRREGSPVGRGSWPFFRPLNLTAPPHNVFRDAIPSV